MTRGPSSPRSQKGLIFFTVFLDLFAFALLLPKLQLYADALGAHGVVRGSLISVYAFMTFIAAPFWGRLSDRVGRRPIIAWCLFGTFIAFVVLAFARNLPLLFLARALGGIAAGNISAAQAYMADITPPEKRTQAMGLIGAAFGLGFIFGPAVGGPLGSFGTAWLGLHGGILLLGVLGAAVSLVNTVLVVLYLPESVKRESAESALGIPVLAQVLTTPRLILLIGLFAAMNFAFSNMESTVILMMFRRHGWADDVGGMLLAYVGVFMAFVQGFLVGRASKRLGDPNTLRIGAFLLVPALSLLAWAPNLPWVLLLFGLLALGAGLGNPTMHSIISRSSPREIQGGIFGVTQGVGSLCRVVGPLVGNRLLDINAQYPYTVAGVVTALAFLGVLFVRLPHHEGEWVPA